jgi:hypothetical protein
MLRKEVERGSSLRRYVRTLGTLAVVACSACGAAQVQPRGRLAPEVIQREVRSHYGVFQRCYEAGLARNPNLAGRVVVRFVIERDGSVQQAENGGGDMPDPEVIKCLVAEYKRLKFPSPEGGIVTVVYPIMFSPGDDTSTPPRSQRTPKG